MILGIDEVGRGPWAGPLVVGAVLLGDAQIEGLNDSKKLTKKKREKLDIEIRGEALAWSLGWVGAAELDRVGMSWALRLACRRAVEQIQVQCREQCVGFNEIIIDGTVNFLSGTALEKHVTIMAKADGLIASVSAASIIAKVARDNYMAEREADYPGYGFISNAGYGTSAHRVGIEHLGICPEHRLSFAPVKKYITAEKWSSRAGNLITAADDRENTQTTRQIGDGGEQVAVNQLEADGHTIINRNWRTRWCEIDIVSIWDNTIFFTEVKYRKNAIYGDGLDAITIKKQQQMRFATEIFLARHPQYSDYDVQLLAIDVSGQPPVVQQIVEV